MNAYKNIKSQLLQINVKIVRESNYDILYKFKIMRNSCNCEKKNCCYNFVTIVIYDVEKNYENKVAVVKFSHNCQKSIIFQKMCNRASYHTPVKTQKSRKFRQWREKHCLINDGKFHEWLGKDFIRLHIIITVIRNKVTIMKYSCS